MALKPTYEELEQIIRELESRYEEMEKKFSVNVERYKLATSSAKVGVWDWNIKTDDFYLDPNIKAILGYADDEIPNDLDVWVKFIHPADSEAVMEAAQACLDGKVAEYIYEHRMLHKDGSIRWILVRGKVIRDENNSAVRLIGTDTDITDIKQVEEALRASEEKYRGQFDESIAATYVFDEKKNFLDSNQAGLDLLGYSREELLKMSIPDVDVDPLVVIPAHEQLLGGYRISNYEHQLNRKDGKVITVLNNSRPITDTDGNVIGMQSTLIDITAWKQAEEEKKKLEERIQQVQRIEALGTLAGGLAHNFNNLLMVIQGNASFLLCDMDSSHPYYDPLKNIEKSVRSGAKLTKQLLGYARKGKYQVETINLNQLAEETADTIGRTRKETIIHCEFSENLSAIRADQRQIEQVLWNLCINAVDSMPGGGKIIIKTLNVSHAHMNNKLYDPKPGSYVRLTVTDTGIGMDRETRERIFEPFYTTKEMGMGTGLGLSSVYGIIKSHGGYIEVESEKGHGTTFAIFFPACRKEIPKAIKSTDKIIKGSGMILLVDDEELILDASAKMLEGLGYKVLKAGGGLEAVKIYEENKKAIVLVILDMIMPEMSGGDTYDKMKKINPTVKVLLSSGYSADGQAAEILKRGCNGFIQKPFNSQKLSGKIKEIVSQSNDSHLHSKKT